MSLNPKQKAAVACEGHCLVVACPGSGKSKVVVSKVEEIIKSHPEPKIVVTTFSKEGANELRERLSHVLSAEQMQAVYTSTFHSLAFAHLKREGIPIRIAKDTNEFLMRAIEITGSDISLEEAQQLLQNCKTTPNFKPGSDLASIIYNEYQKICKNNNVMDFYDVMSLSLSKMQDGSLPVLNATHMLVDEFQDCDEIQYQYMMAHVKTGKVTVTAVGDDDQAIYAFRNSLGYSGMERFEREARAQRVILDTNYRCKREILSAAGKMISFNTSRMDKRLFAHRGPGGSIHVTRYPERIHESEAVVSQVIRNIYDVDADTYINERQRFQQGIEAKKWVVLARNNILLEGVDAEFKKFGIPTIKTFKPIWEKPPVSHMLNLMKSFDSKDKTNIEHLLYWVGFDQTDLKLLGNIFKDDFSKLFDKKVTEKLNTEKLSVIGSKKIKSFIKDLNGWSKGNSKSDPERTHTVISSIGSWMIGNCKKKRDKSRLHIALSVLLKVNGSMLERVAFVTKKSDDKDGNGVHLMTMHGSKGLEFENVWIIAAETDIIPSSANLVITERIIEEERRLMYVAMTRAKDKLYISSTADNPVSVFLRESNLA